MNESAAKFGCNKFWDNGKSISTEVILYVRLTRQYFIFFICKYYKCLKRKIKTPQLTFIKTNQPKIHK